MEVDNDAGKEEGEGVGGGGIVAWGSVFTKVGRDDSSNSSCSEE